MIWLYHEYKKIAKKITRIDIQSGIDENELTMESLLNFGRVSSCSNLFLGVFSNSGLMYILKKFRIIDELAKKGLTDITTEVDTSDTHTHKMYVYNGEPNPANVVCELVAKIGPLNFDNAMLKTYPKRFMSFLQVEWLLLQNPKTRFTEKKPRLPGQSYPGLGLGRNMMILLILMAKNLRLNAIVNKPHFFHTAFFFTKKFIFVNPYKQSEVEALSRDLLKKYSVYDIAWASNFEAIIKNNGEYFTWEPEFLIYPMSKRLQKYFDSKDYKKIVSKNKKEISFSIDDDKYRRRLKEYNLDKNK